MLPLIEDVASAFVAVAVAVGAGAGVAAEGEPVVDSSSLKYKHHMTSPQKKPKKRENPRCKPLLAQSRMIK